MSKSKRLIGDLTNNRIEAFSDGIFAIAMTLLVLQISVPEIPQALVAIELPRKLLSLWPGKLLSYAVSFVLIGIYWVTHHITFHHIKRSDPVLLWLNILFLMCVSFIPFPTSLIGQYAHQQLTVIIYSSTLGVTGLVSQLLWWYATSDHRLVDSDINPRVVSLITRRNLTPVFIYLLSIGVSFFSVDLSTALLFVVPVLYILPSPINRY